MRIRALASGSSGNCIYAGTDATHILIDTGISGKKTKEGLETLDISPDDIDAILVTHEHIDHVAGLGVLARKYGIPIYATRGTIEGTMSMKQVGEIDQGLIHEIDRNEKFRIKDLDIQAISVSHDANDPCAYRFESEGKRAAVITDLGTYDEQIVEKLKGLDALYVEANHDVRMLQVGPYPYLLKMRILGKRGHLCNEDSGKLISSLLHDGIKEIMLGHLSHENNYPDLAYETVRLEIMNSDNKYKPDDFKIGVARRSEVSDTIIF